ncbi:hypothetical protein FHS83_003261 [Rhizomicrobium palustre]|uniref:DUF4412 domain-containing protein n=1 Tax=Rhizomicrobium palustre TaxID=189966 RepID=A0A846N2V4_9PROT|nr:hypothetical protein [Rhizomicrobium palustre]NIK89943.1 hypothetical protein [Rhizomicrobium palustre]
MKTLLLTGLAAAGLTGLALAAAPAIHELTVDVPGGIAHIRYFGDKPPKVEVVNMTEQGIPVGSFVPSPFAEMDRISAIMDRQMSLMMAQAAMMQREANAMSAAPLYSAQYQAMGQGSPFAFTAIAPGGSYCMKSVQITSNGSGAPKVVSQTSGNCADTSPVNNASANKAHAAAPAAQAPLQTISYHPSTNSHPRSGI